jgi:hypothetical protein
VEVLEMDRVRAGAVLAAEALELEALAGLFPDMLKTLSLSIRKRPEEKGTRATFC